MDDITVPLVFREEEQRTILVPVLDIVDRRVNRVFPKVFRAIGTDMPVFRNGKARKVTDDTGSLLEGIPVSVTS